MQAKWATFTSSIQEAIKEVAAQASVINDMVDEMSRLLEQEE